MELTLAGYGNNLINLIIQPAGRSRSFKWLGRGDIKNIPHIPRPIFIPRWIPKERPEYVAKWVPTTPGPQTNSIQSSHQSGFGTPKTNSVVQGQNAPLSYDVPPVKIPSASPLKALAQPLTSVHVPAPTLPSVHAVSPVSSYQTIGYAPPHANDIIQLDNALPAPIAVDSIQSTPFVPKQPPSQQNIIPETAIRNAIPGTLGEPSFSALLQDQLAVDVNGFRPVDPNSVIFIDDGITSNKDTANIVSDVILADDLGSNLNSAVPITFQKLPEQNAPLLSQVSNPIQTDFKIDDSTLINKDELLFVINSDSTLPLTGASLLDISHGNLQSLQDDAGKSFDAPVITQILEPIQSNILHQQNFDAQILSQTPDTLFIEDTSLNSQSNSVNNFNADFVLDDFLKINNSNQQNEPQLNSPPKIDQGINSNNPQITGQLQVNQGSLVTDVPQFILESKPDKNTDTIDIISGTQQEPSPQENFLPSNLNQENQQNFIPSNTNPQLQQNFIPSNINDVFLINTEIIQPGENFQTDQQAQFSSFQVGQKINFGPLPIQDHDTTNRPLAPTLIRPALLAPPASPVIASERSFSLDHSGIKKPLIPSGRSISTDHVIPQPVPIPMGPMASLTLDFPAEGPGVRQARVNSGFLPFGKHLHSRPSRQFRSYPFLFGK
ncbi:uncharacterized protein [Palaemon carinicauda]